MKGQKGKTSVNIVVRRGKDLVAQEVVLDENKVLVEDPNGRKKETSQSDIVGKRIVRVVHGRGKSGQKIIPLVEMQDKPGRQRSETGKRKRNPATTIIDYERGGKRSRTTRKGSENEPEPDPEQPRGSWGGPLIRVKNRMKRG